MGQSDDSRGAHTWWYVSDINLRYAFIYLVVCVLVTCVGNQHFLVKIVLRHSCPAFLTALCLLSLLLRSSRNCFKNTEKNSDFEKFLSSFHQRSAQSHKWSLNECRCRLVFHSCPFGLKYCVWHGGRQYPLRQTEALGGHIGYRTVLVSILFVKQKILCINK